MRKILLMLALLMASGYSLPMVFGEACYDANNLISNVSQMTSESYLNISNISPCQYGCDIAYGHCKLVESGAMAVGLVALIFFTICCFWLSHFFKPKPTIDSEGNIVEASMWQDVGSMVFLFTGLISLWFTLVYAASTMAGLNSSLLDSISNAVLATSSIYGWVIWLVIIVFVIAFVMHYIRQSKEIIEENMP